MNPIEINQGYKRQYWGYVIYRNKARNIGPFATRDEALSETGKQFPTRRNINTGYGSAGAHFDIQWAVNPHKNSNAK